MNWKLKLREARRATLLNGKTAHRVAVLLRELYADRDFLKQACDDRPDKADEILGDISGRFALSPADMVVMIERFPALASWEGGRLDRLRDTALTEHHRENYNKRLEQQNNERRKAEQASLNGCAAVSESAATILATAKLDRNGLPSPETYAGFKKAAARLEAAHTRIAELEKENASLRKQVRSLKRELAKRPPARRRRKRQLA